MTNADVAAVARVIESASQMAYERSPEDFTQLGEPSYLQEARDALTRLSERIDAGWKCLAVSKAACAWPDCGCDPEATKVIAALVEQGWLGPYEVSQLNNRIGDALSREPKWQPIETAPKDGTRVLVAEAGFWMAVARFVPADMSWIETEASGLRLNAPTHWMPLPASPSEAEGSK